MRVAFIVIISGWYNLRCPSRDVCFALPTRDYDLSVDALKDEQSLFTNAWVVIKNTGSCLLQTC